jgi:hypothetical protein
VGPVLECPTAFDLGSREKGEAVLTPFLLTNQGDQPLEITDVRTQCSCTKLEKEGNGVDSLVTSLTIEPGRSYPVTIRTTVQGVPGQPAQFVIGFRTNDPVRPSVTIAMFVSAVRGGVYASPATVVFGTKQVGQDATSVFDICDDGPVPRRIELVETCATPGLSARLLAPQEVVGPPAPGRPAVIGRVEVRYPFTGVNPVFLVSDTMSDGVFFCPNAASCLKNAWKIGVLTRERLRGQTADGLSGDGERFR